MKTAADTPHGPGARTAFTIVAGILALGAALGLFFGVRSLFAGGRLFEKDVSERFVVYIEGLRPAGKLVLLEGTQRYTASREFTARILAVVRVDARIELSAIADTAYFVDLSDPSKWKASWSPRTKKLRLHAPSPDLLPPAVRTDSIEVRTEGANLLSSAVFRLKKEAETMKSELSRDMLAQGRKALAAEELRERIAARLREVAATFCESVLSITPEGIEVVFAAGPATSP